MMEFQTFFISSENHSRVFRRCTNSCRCPKFPSRLMYLQFVFPSRVVSGGLARCLLMCISRRLDDQRVIGAVGEGTEVHGRSRKTADYQPALATRYCTGKIHIKNTKPFSKTHNRAILIYVQLCMSARRRECKEKSKTNSV